MEKSIKLESHKINFDFEACDHSWRFVDHGEMEAWQTESRADVYEVAGSVFLRRLAVGGGKYS